MSTASPYIVADTLHLWYLGRPAQPVRVGSLHLVMGGRGVSLRYAPDWLRQGFALSEDLPLIDREHLPTEKDCAAGAVDDARPDRWGERVIRLLYRPPRLSLLELLYFTGDDRFGALGVSTSSDHYLPHESPALPQLGDAQALHALVRRVQQGASVDEVERRLIAPGATMGGARPKALVDIDGQSWVLKFGDEASSFEGLLEHASLTLAALAGIRVATTRPVPLASGIALAIERFDRAQGQRLHALSAHVALRAAGSEPGYPALAQLLRRRGVVADGLWRHDMHELFRRLVFNILIDNTDDHEKNHVLLVQDTQQLRLSPAFDVLPAGQALGYQSMHVGKDGSVSRVDNALSMAAMYGLGDREALDEARRVARVVDGWQAHFNSLGVSAATTALLADQIDRPFLREQRRSLLSA
ncbi:type II toxin-antitoxin system HipA family toxin [Hydrogenophaga sp. PBL-H3]|uniref:type II toxin-antitoxin system HipA family toxin n=1 Tax=Hydrogenophaga sp. PBL-H3 TaxID=434010 RepID=UPI00131F6883|nr:type II toxin-antitoxin system HipA family toxin [Hydrogenophaga sp. PBL-H3]QHE74724.1 type II toxin-antitoxin system HipA family toxin [Hydrogenophaga sp. PBL-H3]QHE79150.1 type II toxin-antitoxin system HipA family toxin [Hydrogenophaga sp. PBL-H3]